MGMILKAQVSSIFRNFMHSFQKLASDLGDFETLCVVEKDTENALHAN